MTNYNSIKRAETYAVLKNISDIVTCVCFFFKFNQHEYVYLVLNGRRREKNDSLIGKLVTRAT